jgi:hypothetical protein
MSESEIDEYACLQEWCKRKTLTVADARQCDERYWRYLYKISSWSDSEGNDYSYVREKVYDFVRIENTRESIDLKYKLMKYIDGEIMMMMSICLMRELDV